MSAPHSAKRLIYLKLLCDTKCSIYSGFGKLAEHIEQIQQRPEYILPLEGVDLPEFRPAEFKKLAFEAEALVGGAGGAIVGGTICMAVMGTGAVAGGILGSGFVLCAMGLNMIDRACEKKKQAEQIREDVKRIVEFYGKLSDASDSYRKDLEKVQTKFTKYLNKVARILERKVNWEDFSNAEKRHVENAVMLAQLLCYMCSINLVIDPTVDEPLERLNEADIKKAKADADDVMSQLKIRLMFS